MIPGSSNSFGPRSSAPGSSSTRKRLWSVWHSTIRVAELGNVTRRHPDLRVHEDARVEPDDVVALRTIARHQARLTLFLSSTPSGP